MARMTDDELLAAVEARESTCYGYGEGELSEQRAEAIRRFLAQPLGTEKEGRSDIVSTDIRDTILSIMPQLLRVFLGGDEVVRFAPQGPEDEAAAKSESEYLNWVLIEKNDAFSNFHAAFFDVLTCGNGYIKAWWDKSSAVLMERYQGKTDDELALLMQDPDVEIVEHTQYPDPSYVPVMRVDPATGQPMPPAPAPMLHDVVARRNKLTEYARYEAVPPEELYVSETARGGSLKSVDFVQHRKRVTLSELRDMGYDAPDDLGGWFDEDTDSPESDARDRFGFGNDWDRDYDGDPSMRRVTYRESYLLIDADRNGRAELRKVCVVGRKVLNNEEVDLIPIAGFCGIPFAHRHQGLSLYDLLAQEEKTRTEVTRQFIDGLRVQNNPRLGVDASRVNVEDLLTSRPNSLVRVQGNPGEAMLPIMPIPVGPAAMEALNWLDSWKQSASGVSPAFMGGEALDATKLNTTATGLSQMISQSQMRVESIARSLADGVRDLVEVMHALTLKHATRAEKVRLQNQWVLIDPRSWVKRADLEVVVALGSGTKEMRAMQLQQLIALQTQLLPIGVATPQNLYNSVARLANELGYRNADEFVSNPATQPPAPPPPPDPLVQAQQIKTQGELQKAQMDQQSSQQQAVMDAQAKQAELEQDAALERYKAQLQAEVEREKVQVNAQAQIEIARIKASIEADSAGYVEKVRLGVPLANDERHAQHAQGLQQIMSALQQMQSSLEVLAGEVARIQAPKTIVRDQRGRVVGTAGADGQMVQQVVRDPMGRVAGVAPAGRTVQ